MPRLRLLPLEDRLAPANLTMTGLRTVDASNNLQANPVYGQMLYLRANWNSTAMAGGETCTVRYSVNGFPSDSGAVNHSAGNGSWFWWRGGWYIGTSAITVTATVDPDNLIAETNESDNTFTLTITPIAPTDLPAKFLTPIGRTANADWAINNYADVDPRSGTAQDARGGGYEYDGHDAIDAGPWGNDGMDAGFPIYAAAGGTITQVADGNFDRQTSMSGAAGNYVRINHGNNWETLYYHFAKDSITVKVGDVVKAGQVIGLMGSSGNSTGTHLHYTAFYRGSQVEAEFAPSTYWQNPLPYAGDATAFAMDAWISNQDPSADVSERFPRLNAVSSTQTGTLYFPAIVYNIRTPNVTSTMTWKWYRPNGTVWNSFTQTPGANYRFSWWYRSFAMSNFTSTPGTWNYAFEVNGVEQKRVPFTVNATGEPSIRMTTATATIVSDERTTPYTFPSTAIAAAAPTQAYTITNLGGAALSLTGWTAPLGFSFVGSPPASVAAGASATFTVQMNTSAVGYQFGRVFVATNDPGHPEFTFNVDGTVTGAVNPNAPVVTLSDAALAYNLKSLPRRITPNATLTDSNSSTIAALSVYLSSGAQTGDTLDLRNEGTGPGQVGLSGTTILYGGVAIGTRQPSAAPTTFTVQFNVGVTVAMAQAVMQNVTYASSLSTPTFARRYVSVGVLDATGLASNWAVETVTPSGVERAPTLAAISNATTTTALPFTRGGSFSDVFGNSWTATVNYGSGIEALTLNPDKSFTLTKLFTTPGTYPVTVTINSDTGGTKSATFNVLVVTPPTVTGLVINSGAAQRSRITRLDITLNVLTPGLLAEPGAVTLTNESTSVLPAQSIAGNTLTLTFPAQTGVEFGSLSDGVWTLAIPSANYTATVKRLFGDFNGDGTVDGGTDFTEFKFQTSANDPFDFNADGVVDGPTDFAEFGLRFGRTV